MIQSRLIFSSFTLLVFFISCVNTQINLQCPSTPLTISNGAINFTSLSEGSDPVDATYNASLVSRTWYSLANGFVDVVRSGNLPYELIVPVINTTFIQSSPTENGQGFDPITFLQNFASWWAGILVVTLLGIVLAQCFCVCGCCYWCCRCCGNCGGGKYQKHSKNNDCLMFTFAVILFLITLFLLAAAVLSFFSNEKTFQNLTNLQVTVNSVADDTVNYLSDTFREVFELFCQFFSDGGVADSVLNEIEVTGGELGTIVGEIATELQESSIQQLPILQDARNIVSNIFSTEATFSNATNVLESSLESLVGNLISLSGACGFTNGILCSSAFTPVIASARAAINELPDAMELSDIGSFVENLNIALGSIDGQDQRELNNFLNMNIAGQLDSSLSQVRSIIQPNGTFSLDFIEQIGTFVNDILDNDFVADQCPPLDGFQAFSNIVLPNFNFFGLNDSSSSGTAPTTAPTTTPGVFELTLGYARQCIINASFDYIRMFDTYRYAFGIIVCSLSLVTIGLIWLGIMCGLLGFRKGRAPSERSSLSNCGGIFLLLSVGVTFLFGFFLLLLCAIFFFFGANSLKICQALEGPEYDLFAQTIDSPEVRASIEALGGNTSVRISDIPSISDFFRQCETEDTALFSALNLGSLLPLPSGTIGGAIRNIFNITQLRSTIDSSVMNGANVTPAYFADLIQNGIDSFVDFNFIDINITGIVASVESAIVQADLNDSIEALQNLTIELAARNESDIVVEVNNVISDFENIRDNVVPVILSSVNELADLVQQLPAIQANLSDMATVTPLVDQIAQDLSMVSQSLVDRFINNTIRGSVARSIGFIDQYIDHLENQITNTVGGCQPMYGIYTQFHNVICRDFIDGLNGFWWSLGLCAILYIPLIIFATLTASYFRKKKTRNDDYNHEYPLKAF